MMRSLVKVTSLKNGGCRSWWNSNVICTQDHCKVFFLRKGLSVNKDTLTKDYHDFTGEVRLYWLISHEIL